MKHTIVFFMLFTTVFSVWADDYDFSGLQGLRDKKGNVYFEISGYDIFTTVSKGKSTELQTINRIKKQYKIRNIQAEYSDAKRTTPNYIIEAEQSGDKNPSVKSSRIFYLLQKSEKEIAIVSFYTINQRDIILEKEFINAFEEKSLEEYISDDWTGEAISFLGRNITLGTACQWRSPHNLFYGGGQISWSEFASAESAGLDLDARIAANNQGDYTILSEDYIEVIFEAVPTIACRIVYKLKSYYAPLIVYYVTQEVRGKHISCVMSNYGINRNDYGLSPLIQQFMSIPNPPGWAHNRFDIPQYEESPRYRRIYPWPVNFQFRLGSVLPLGNLNRIFQLAPSFDFYMGIPLKEKMSIDFGFLMAFPVNPRTFDFTYRNEVSETKMRSLVSGNLRYSYSHKLNNAFSCKTYAGVGFSMLYTDLVEKITDDNQKIYHDITTFDLLGGVQLKYKRVGCFIEYHRAPFSNSPKVANNFGNSFLSIGFTCFLGGF
jgi:hypothetical protein